MTKSAHARFSPSSSERWLTCPGSVPFVERLRKAGTIPPDTDSEYSREGTAAHTLLAWCLTKGLPVHAHPKKTIDGFPIANFRAAVADSYAYVLRLKAKLKAKMTVEQRVSIPAIRDHGTIDVRLWNDKELHVLDFKNGSGVAVEAEENTQLGLYATGVSFEQRVTHLHIMQPNLEPQFKTWQAPRDWLIALGARAQKAIASAPTAPLTPSPAACRWCPGKAHCPALLAQAKLAVRKDWKTESLPAALPVKAPTVAALTFQQLSEIHGKSRLIIQFLEAVEKALYAELLKRKPKVTGWKLVAGKSRRTWRADALVVKAMRNLGIKDDEFRPRKLIGLGDMEKLLRMAAPKMTAEAIERWMSKHTVTKLGAPTLVPDSDPRLPYQPSDAKADWKDES